MNFETDLNPDRDPPPLPPGYGVEPVIETPPLPPGYGEPLREEKRPNRRRPRWRFRIPVTAVFFAAACLGLYYGPLSYVVHFVDDRGRAPAEFVATLHEGSDTSHGKLVIVERGELRVMRLRWSAIAITDQNYEPGSSELKGDGQLIHIQRTTSRKLKDAYDR